MNYHSDEYIMNKLKDHYDDGSKLIDSNHIFVLALQGSQNYGLDYEESDIDSKLITLPTLKDIVFNKQPISTTHIRDNNEHIDLKDLRLYTQTFRKQNLNFIEILFTKYYISNPYYDDLWNELISHNEEIARLNPYQAIKSMKGIAMEKYYAMEHRYPSRVPVIDKYGYDPKQLHHLIRVAEFIKNYINDKPYSECIIPKDSEYLISIKKGIYSFDEAKQVADSAIAEVIKIADDFSAKLKNECNPIVDKLLDDIQYTAIERALKQELI